MRKIAVQNFFTQVDFEPIAQGRLSLRKSEIGVFRVHLANMEQWVHKKLHLLNPKEHAYRQNFLREKDRLRFAVGRICTKEIAANYLQIKPEQIQIKKGTYGKPMLLQYEDTLQYNLSHSGDFVTLAFAVGAELGIDIEQMRYMRDYRSLCACLHPYETERVLTSGNFEAFYWYWVAKEAYIKADGRGFGLNFKDFYIGTQDKLFTKNGIEIENYHLVRILETEQYAEALVYRERAGVTYGEIQKKFRSV